MVRRSICFVSTTSQSRLEGEYPSWDVKKENFLQEVFFAFKGREPQWFVGASASLALHRSLDWKESIPPGT